MTIFTSEIGCQVALCELTLCICSHASVLQFRATHCESVLIVADAVLPLAQVTGLKSNAGGLLQCLK